MNIWKVTAAAFAALMLHVAIAAAATTSTIVTIPAADGSGACSLWTSLGPGPFRLFSGSSALSYAISDAAPTSAIDLTPLPAAVDKDIPTTTNVWICNSKTQSPVALRVAPILAPGSGYSSSGQMPSAGAFTSAATCGTGTAASWSSAFTPIAGRDFDISAYGTFVATLQLERSFDNGVTWLPITAAGTQLYRWTSAFSESASEGKTGVLYHLNCTSYTSGTVNFRLEQ